MLRLGQWKDFFIIIIFLLNIIFKVTKSSTNPPGLSSCFCRSPQQRWGLLLLQRYLQKERLHVKRANWFPGILQLHEFNTVFFASTKKMVVVPNGWCGVGSVGNKRARIAEWIRTWASTLLPVVFGRNHRIHLWHSGMCACTRAIDGWLVIDCCSACRYK